MKNFNYIAKSGVMLLLAALSFVACADKNDWDTDESFDRLFSVTKMNVSTKATEVEYTWTTNNLAEYYIIELSRDSLYDAIAMGQHESSIVYGEDKSIKTSPIILDGLESDTKYFLRVKAFSSLKEESRWAYLEDYSFETKSEQLIESIEASANSISLTWPAASKVTDIAVYDADGELVKTKALTSDEIAAGEATVTDLASETEFTVRLLNGSKTRGIKTISTLIDLGGAILISPEDDIMALLSIGEDGDVFAIMPGTYDVEEEITLTKTISVKSVYPGDKRAVINGMSFALKKGVGLELKDLILTGGTANPNQLINYLEENKDNETPALSVIGCDITSYKAFINMRKTIEVESMTISGCVINKVSGRLIDIQAGYAKAINITNNTISNSSMSGDGALRIDNKGGFNNIRSVITISNNTFYKVAGTVTKGLVYVRLVGNEITLSKNLITYSDNGMYSTESSTNVVEMTGNYYFQADSFLSEGKVPDTNGTKADPQFANAEEGDFTLQNNAIIDAGVGDPRWW